MKTADAHASLASRILDPGGLITGWATIPDPLVAAHLAQEDLDAVCLDMQHGHFDVRSAILAIAQILMAGKPAIVRVPVRDFPTASRMLDAGASGIIAPMINSADDARLLVEYTKFAPQGGRSWGPALALAHNGYTAGEYLKLANARTVVLAMIETREALDAIDDILAVDGIDGAFVGPTDLSLSLAGGANVDATRADVDEQLTFVAGRCKAHNKAVSAFAIPNSKARDLIARGFNLIAIGTDAIQLRQSTKELLAAARAG
jgi:4-hydroxy-2-oxoheptanedioate aldolase